MTLGFISLLLSVTGRYISRICIPVGAADTMLPCSLRRSSSEQEVPGGGGHVRRHLSGDPTNFKCAKVSNFLCATSSHFCRGRNCFCSSVQLYMPQSEQFLCARSSHLFSGRSRFWSSVQTASFRYAWSFLSCVCWPLKMQMTTWQGMVSLVSADGLHQLHIFVFFLAVFHVAFSAITMSLGRAKVRSV